MESIVFVIMATTLVAMAMCVAVARNPLRAALALIAALCAQAILYILLEAPFVAAMQILVYAGAIMVLFLFVIMLLNLGPDAIRRPAYLAISKVMGALATAYLVLRIAYATVLPTGSIGRPIDGSVKAIGRLLLTDYLFSFEAISMLLLVAVVGAVVLGMKRLT